MTDRSVAPPVHRVQQLFLPPPKVLRLSNGVPVYVTNMGTQDVTKIQLVFRAGRPFERKKLIARATAGLLKEGTRSFDSAAIAEQVDFYGATLGTSCGLDVASVTLYSLNRHLHHLWPLLSEVLLEPVFPQRELDTYIENNKRRLQVDLTKNDVVAYRLISERLFGRHHPYGYNSSKRAYNGIKRADLQAHFSNHFTARNCEVFVSGRVTEELLQSLSELVEQLPTGRRSRMRKMDPPDGGPQREHVRLPESMQTAMRIGRRIMPRTHADFVPFTVLNTIFGGYFGSRLNMNIREEKGYTYSIYSTQDNMQQAACLYVASEVNNESLDAARREIYLEMEKLCNDLVPAGELEMVRNYMLGNMLNMVDGPFNVGDAVRMLRFYGLPHTAFSDLVDTVNGITSQQLRDLAQRYLAPNSMWEVTVGA